MNIRFVGCWKISKFIAKILIMGIPVNDPLPPPISSLLRNHSNQRRWFVERAEKTRARSFSKFKRARNCEIQQRTMDGIVGLLYAILVDVFVMQGVLVDARRLAGAYIRTMVSRPLSTHMCENFYRPSKVFCKTNLFSIDFLPDPYIKFWRLLEWFFETKLDENRE